MGTVHPCVLLGPSGEGTPGISFEEKLFQIFPDLAERDRLFASSFHLVVYSAVITLMSHAAPGHPSPGAKRPLRAPCCLMSRGAARLPLRPSPSPLPLGSAGGFALCREKRAQECCPPAIRTGTPLSSTRSTLVIPSIIHTSRRPPGRCQKEDLALEELGARCPPPPLLHRGQKHPTGGTLRWSVPEPLRHIPAWTLRDQRHSPARGEELRACSKAGAGLNIVLLFQCMVPYGSTPLVNYAFFPYLNKMIC